MSDVVALRPHTRLADERKAQFMDTVAQSYDLYVQDHGAVPDAIVYVMGGVCQPARVAHHLTGASEGGASSFRALAGIAITKDIIIPD